MLSERQITWLNRTFPPGTKIEIDNASAIPTGTRVVVKEIDVLGKLICDFNGKTVEVDPSVDIFRKII